MHLPSQRTVFRWIHITISIPILGYIYSPFEKLPDYAPATRFVFLPHNDSYGTVDVEGPFGAATLYEATSVTGCRR